MPPFSREDPLSAMVSLRVTAEQGQLIEEMARVLGLRKGKAELLRRALDYWMEHAPEAREAAERLRKGKGGG